MPTDRRLFLAATGAALFAPALLRAQDRTLALYSSRHYDTDRELYDAFTRQTGVRIRLIEANADQLLERIRAEGANSPADVLITVDAGRLARAQEAGVLAPVRSAVCGPSSGARKLAYAGRGCPGEPVSSAASFG